MMARIAPEVRAMLYLELAFNAVGTLEEGPEKHGILNLLDSAFRILDKRFKKDLT